MSGNFAPGDLVTPVDKPGKEWHNYRTGKQCDWSPTPKHVYCVTGAKFSGRYPAIQIDAGGGVWFHSDEFRPVDPRRLEIFRKALTSRPVKEDA